MTEERSRFAFVIELLCTEPVGRGKAGNDKIVKYLTCLSKSLDQDPVSAPSSNFSQKYGIAAWLPLANGGAIHFYAWDNRKPSFVSVDIASSSPIRKDSALDYTSRYFKASPRQRNLVYRSISPPPPTWKELAQDVYRQRLTIVARSPRPPGDRQVAEFLPRLARELEMVPLRAVFVSSHDAWMHWETSGCVLSWRKELISLDIYTCKPFDAKRAQEFTRWFFSLKKLQSYCY